MALIGAAGIGGGSGGTTAPVNTTGATLLVACVSVDSSTGTVPTPTDSLGVDTWVPLTQVGGANPPFFRSRLFYVENPTTNAAFTVTVSGTNASVTFAAFNATLTSGVFDLEAASGGAATNATETAQGGAVTPSGADALIISGGGVEATRTLSVGGGFSIAHQEPHVGGVSYGSFIGYRAIIAPAAQDPAWTWTGQGATNAVVLNAVFKATPTDPVTKFTAQKNTLRPQPFAPGIAR